MLENIVEKEKILKELANNAAIAEIIGNQISSVGTWADSDELLLSYAPPGTLNPLS
jgi:hypothetical protein